jgi:hypothetical protein
LYLLGPDLIAHLLATADEFITAHHPYPFAASFSKEHTVKARALIYATLFTAGLQALAIFATQEHPASGRVLTVRSALAAPAPAVARTGLPAATPFTVPAPIRAAAEPTPIAQNAPKPANAARAAMANATEKLNNTRPLYDSTVRQHRMVRKHQMVRRQHWLAMSYMGSQPSGSNY